METQKIHTTHSLLYSRTVPVFPVDVEVMVSNVGIGIHIVGVPDDKAKEMLLRVITAIEAQGYRIPGKKIVINITLDYPSNIYDRRLVQNWTMIDLAVAMGILVASGQVEEVSEDTTYIGALGLDGDLRMPYDFIDYIGPVLSYVKENNIYLVAPGISCPKIAFRNDISSVLQDFTTKPVKISDTSQTS